jgi:hypothetical protein
MIDHLPRTVVQPLALFHSRAGNEFESLSLTIKKGPQSTLGILNPKLCDLVVTGRADQVR